jgi:RNA-directed DNA polymerase
MVRSLVRRTREPQLSEPASASLHKSGVANPPDWAKPDIDRVAMGKSTCRTPRGDWGRRAWNEPSGTWETRPSGCVAQRRQGIHNLPSGSGRESAGFIVALKRGNARGAKGPCQVRASVRGREDRLEETPTTDKRFIPPTLSLLRQKLSQKAKQEPKFRFYTLYGRIFQWDTLWAAWNLVASNQGAPGIDGVTFSQVADGTGKLLEFLEELQQDLRTKRYQPQPVRRVYIPKANGKLRPLGIPTIRDRVVQMAVLLILEPIFEADFLDCSYGFRPGKSAHQALEAIRRNLHEGFQEVYDADLQGYFDSIPHDKLMACLGMRIADRSVLRLIRLWLEAPVVEQTEDNQTKVSRPGQGTPQGGVISPLLANVYLHWFDKRFHAAGGPGPTHAARLVRYADDFVVMARRQSPELVGKVESLLEDWLGLKINRDKTRVVNLGAEGTQLDFLGYTFRYDRDLYGRDRRYLNLCPSAKALERERGVLHAMTSSRYGWKPLPVLIQDLNRHLRGWLNYFHLGYPRRAFRQIGHHVRYRLGQHLRRRSQRAYRVPKGTSLYRHLRNLGLMPI